MCIFKKVDIVIDEQKFIQNGIVHEKKTSPGFNLESSSWYQLEPVWNLIHKWDGEAWTKEVPRKGYYLLYLDFTIHQMNGGTETPSEAMATCELMRTAQFYTETPQQWPLYSLYDQLQPQTDEQRHQWMLAERKARKAANIEANRKTRAKYRIYVPNQPRPKTKVAE